MLFPMIAMVLRDIFFTGIISVIYIDNYFSADMEKNDISDGAR